MKQLFSFSFSFFLVVFCFLSCGNGKTSSTKELPDENTENQINAPLIDSIKSITQNYGSWSTDLNEGSGLVNPIPSTQKTELLYDADKEKFFLRELWIDNKEIKSDTIYECKIKKTKKGFLLIGIGDECTYEISSNDLIEGIWPDDEYRTKGIGSIQFDVVKSLIK